MNHISPNIISTDKYTGYFEPSAGVENQNHNKMKALFESE